MACSCSSTAPAEEWGEIRGTGVSEGGWSLCGRPEVGGQREDTRGALVTKDAIRARM